MTGNPGDGKTYLIRRLEKEISKVQADTILDATAESDYADIVARWKRAHSGDRPFILAINHGPFSRLMALFGSKHDFLREVKRQLKTTVYYDSTPPKPSKQIMVVDLNLRSVLTREIIEAALDNLLRAENFEDCSAFDDSATDACRNRAAMQDPQVRERLIRLLTAASHTARHVSMRDLQGFLSYLVFTGRSSDALQRQEPNLKYRYFNAAFDGEGELFDAVRETFDPLTATSPDVDEALWEHTGLATGWLFGRPPLIPDHYDDAWDQFTALKRQYFFEHEDGLVLLERAAVDDTTFQTLMLVPDSTGKKELGNVVRAINRFYCGGMPDDDQQLRLWASQSYDARTPPVVVSVYRLSRDSFHLRIPRLTPELCAAFEYKPDHILLQYEDDAGTASLRIERGLWRALMLASRGMPMALRSPHHAQRLEKFMARLRRFRPSLPSPKPC